MPALTQVLRRSTYGDVAMRIVKPSGTHTYKLEILNAGGSAVVRTITSVTAVGNYVWIDYPVDQSCVDFGGVPTRLNWKLYYDNVLDQSSVGNPGATVATDNALFVKVRIGIAGQSNGQQHFYLYSGAHPGVQSATKLRNTFASAKGYRKVEVMPVNLSYGGSAAEKLEAYSWDASNYWWDIGANKAGPRLTAAGTAIQAAGGLNYLIISHGERTAEAMRPYSGYTASVDRWTTCWQKSIAAIRAHAKVQNPKLPVFWQALGRGWQNVGATPMEVNGAQYRAIRERQQLLCNDDNEIYMGSWCPGLEVSSNYVTDDGYRVHYAAAQYHKIAVDLGYALAGYAKKPAWAGSKLPVITASRKSNKDITFTISNLNAGKAYRLRNMNINTGAQLVEQSFTPSGTTYSYTFTAAAQKSAYSNSLAGFVYFLCWENIVGEGPGIANELLTSVA